MIVWAYAFIDRPMPRFDAAAAFWTTVTGTTLSPRRGEHDQFATFTPAVGDAYLKLQGVDLGGGAHIDLTTPDIDALRDDAEALGAGLVATEDGLHVLRSPGGQLFCAVQPEDEVHRPPVTAAPGGATSRLDQICIDVTPARFDAEVAFWTALTGWPSNPSDLHEFHVVRSPADIPVRILIQRLDTDRPTSAHVDMACSDVAAIRAWHESSGAEFVADGTSWVVMRDPAGGVYCLTGRDPALSV
jgi:hypothetical protein